MSDNIDNRELEELIVGDRTREVADAIMSDSLNVLNENVLVHLLQWEPIMAILCAWALSYALKSMVPLLKLNLEERFFVWEAIKHGIHMLSGLLAGLVMYIHYVFNPVNDIVNNPVQAIVLMTIIGAFAINVAINLLPRKIRNALTPMYEIHVNSIHKDTIKKLMETK